MVWKEAVAPDGRNYYYDTNTQQTVWEKPADFVEDGSSQPAVASTEGAWKAAKAADGRTYYYNTVTNQTTWEKPAAMQAAPVNSHPITGADFQDRRAPAPSRGFDNSRTNGTPWERGENTGFRGPTAKLDEAEHATPEEAEAAFFKFLRSRNIKYDAVWTDVIRTIGHEKGYRALKDPKDRKVAFEKYCIEEKAAEKNREVERKQRQREQFRRMLSQHDEVTHITRWKTARPMIEREVVFRSVPDEDERKQLFREYAMELQKEHAEELVTAHQRALNELSLLMHTLVISSQLKWEEALQEIEQNQRFINDNTFRALNKVDILKTFESHIKTIDAEQNDKKQKLKQNHYRGQREARDNFKQLLAEQVKAGHIRASTKWTDFHKHIADEPRYQNLLGMPGSTPLELFWDVIEEEERRLRSKRNDAYDVLEAQQFEMMPDTQFADFEKIMHKDSRMRGVPPDDLLSIYEKLMDKVQRRLEDDRIQAEKDYHLSIDVLRSAIKHLRPAVHLDDKFEDVADRIDDLPEARGLDEEARRKAFDKYIRRLQDKDRARREHRNGSRRSYDDDHRRSPELDAYEEDRRKAQADRERQYRKASFALSPPRERREDRRDRLESVYERERRERELERERSYISRADPRDRGKYATLDYGDDDAADSVPGSTRKRRESEISASSKRDNKRARRETREEAPTSAMEVDKDEPALQSGSEEGEIEEV